MVADMQGLFIQPPYGETWKGELPSLIPDHMMWLVWRYPYVPGSPLGPAKKARIEAPKMVEKKQNAYKTGEKKVWVTRAPESKMTRVSKRKQTQTFPLCECGIIAIEVCWNCKKNSCNWGKCKDKHRGKKCVEYKVKT
jgi:hypothetical protein